MTQYWLADDAATVRFGQALAGRLVPGDMVLLEGDLGAGKTALARAIIRALCADADLDVPSPTFALVQPYETPAGTPVLHSDLYRIADPHEIDELGLLDTPEAIVLVEWPQQAPELYARATHRIQLAIPPGGSGRMIDMEVKNADFLRDFEIPSRNP
ncbi:tRNA threonylcarbamoyl adenosine modification protein YjeE [Devosia enhydra]|uniref:tRNA threonylcarbamoyladenosine biosynthesis protein TsaE n=1 Tax=Devosia enhydra TaxID=665118 RepID=A0A1K2I2S0_9HYPH|nr:tRNA (adenosine(37)-N6)-threonylcarbamoyltransferase complex ATPase subunit type 1 TsaE [Devosia enhydra]SFZ86523.1 tRNA threonylcarbamoyl adenosine modification protein YjeE [Devosia enhydra]